MFAERDKHYPSRSGQTSPATAVTDFTKSVANIKFGACISLSKCLKHNHISLQISCGDERLRQDGEEVRARGCAATLQPGTNLFSGPVERHNGAPHASRGYHQSKIDHYQNRLLGIDFWTL